MGILARIFVYKDYLYPNHLPKIFNELAGVYQEAFPESLKNLLVVSTTDKIYASPGIVEEQTRNIKQIKGLIKDMAIGKTAAGKAAKGFVDTEVLKIISMKLNKHAGYVSSKYPKKMNAIGVFDHEIGHLVVKEGWPSNSNPHIAECAADAFAVLRHLQRFGDTTDIFEYAPKSNAVSAIIFERSPIHYTSAINQKIANIHRDKIIDIQSLSLKETAALAGELAIKYSLDDKIIEKISAAFAPVRECHSYIGVVKSIVQITYQNKDDLDIYRIGKLSISDPVVKALISVEAIIFPTLRKTLGLMEQHEKDSGFVLNAADAIDAKRAAQKKPAPAKQEIV